MFRLLFCAAFGFVLAFQTTFAKAAPHVTGIGGVFFKAKGDHKALASWYEKHLGMKLEPFGAAILRWTDDQAEDKGVTIWETAEKNTTWFRPGDSDFMINYRVDDLDGLLANLRRDGVRIVQGPESHENGKFAWILDLENNKVELWEPKIWREKHEKK